MQMLGSRQGMGGGERERGRRGPRGRLAPGRREARGGQARGAGSKFDDFEDDIPF